jgi:hypothetical protein
MTAMLFMAIPAWSLPFTFAAPVDSIVAYGTGQPDEASEKGYLATYLGLTLPQLEALYNFEKNEAIGENDYKDLAGGFTPGFAWDFAIVKVDGPNDYWYMFMDDNASLLLLSGDDILTTPAQGTDLIPGSLKFNGAGYGISHISWFRPKTAQVPEPLSFLLLGMGLLGIAGIRRKK